MELDRKAVAQCVDSLELACKLKGLIKAHTHEVLEGYGNVSPYPEKIKQLTADIAAIFR